MQGGWVRGKGRRRLACWCSTEKALNFVHAGGGWTVVERNGRRGGLATRAESTDGDDGVDQSRVLLPGVTVL